MAASLPEDVLHEIFDYIARSKPGKRRAGYTYELAPDESDESDSGEVGGNYGEKDEYNNDDDEYDDGEDYDDDDEDEDFEGYSDEDGAPHSGLPHLDAKTRYAMGFPSRFEYIDPVFHPNYALRPLTLVCKSWGQVAERCLYSSISLGSDNDDHGTCGADQAILLADTLSKHPRLAEKVRELRFSTMNCARKESAAQAKIAALCPNVTRFTLKGYNGYVLDKFHAAVKGLKHLQHLEISRYNLRDTECDGFCSIDELIVMMIDWPELETVIFHNHAASPGRLLWEEGEEEVEPEVSSESEEFDSDNPQDVWRRDMRQKLREQDLAKRQQNIPMRVKILNPVVDACPRLKRFEWRECYRLQSVHLHALQTIAPAMEHIGNVSFIHTEKQRITLHSALTRWASTLKTYTFVPLILDKPPVIDETLASSLIRLQKLETSAAFIDIGSLGLLAFLETLTLYVVVTHDVERLTAVIPTLPSLRTLVLQSMVSELEAGYSDNEDVRKVNISKDCVAPLKAVCERHKIKLTVTGI